MGGLSLKGIQRGGGDKGVEERLVSQALRYFFRLMLFCMAFSSSITLKFAYSFIRSLQSFHPLSFPPQKKENHTRHRNHVH